MPDEVNQRKPAARGGAARRRSHLWHEFKLAVVVLVIFTGLKLWFEGTHGGHWLHAQSHLWLQSFIQPPSPDRLPVVVVDITGLKPGQFSVTNGSSVTSEFFTPRDKLELAINRIALAQPAVIAIDVDLSLETNLVPESSLALSSASLKRRALELSTQSIPVFLGVKRNDGLAPADWLGGDDYIPLAASLARPKGIVRQMPSEFEFPGHTNRLRSLSRALASAYWLRAGAAETSSSGWRPHIAWQIVVEAPVEEARDFKLRTFTVDYSPLNILLTNGPSIESVMHVDTNGMIGGTSMARLFCNKMVLLGDATPFKGADTAAVPGVEEPVPGVYVHACAAYTLVHAPLWELKPAVGLTIAFLCSLGALAFIYRACHKHAGRHRVTTIPLNIVLTLCLVVIFLAVGYGLARWLHLLWLEVFAVCLVLVVHCLFEIFFGTVNWGRLKEGPIKPLVVVKNERSHE